MPKFAHWILSALSGFISIASMTGQDSAPARSSAVDSGFSMRIESPGSNSRSLSSGQERIALPVSLHKSGETVRFKNVSITGALTNDALIFQSDSAGVTLTADGFDGWSARLAPRDRVSISINSPQGVLDLDASAENANPISLAFSDGASASVPPGSRIRLDLLKNQTYTVSAVGKALGINADGQKFLLSKNSFPMEGGPLVEVSDAKGKRMTRLRPLVEVKIPRRLEGLLRDEVTDQVIQLAGAGLKTLSLANGAILQLEQSGQNLKWKVLKGYFRFTFQEMSAWKAAGLTGNAGLMLWEDSGKEIDLKNLSENESLLVSLPNATFVRVSPKATFQFASVNSLTFATSASGGTVTLFNANTQLEYPLDTGNLLFKSGLAVNPQHPASQMVKVKLSWNSVGVKINGPGLDGFVEPRSEKVLGQNGTGMLQVTYNESSEVTVRALNQSFSLTLDSLQNGSIKLAEGDAVAFHFDPQRGVLSVSALAENSRPIEFATGNRLSPQLLPSQQATILSTLGTLPGESGNVIFFESAGSDGGTFSTAPAPAHFPTPFYSIFNPNPSAGQIDVSRISQPPASVVR